MPSRNTRKYSIVYPLSAQINPAPASGRTPLLFLLRLPFLVTALSALFVLCTPAHLIFGLAVVNPSLAHLEILRNLRRHPPGSPSLIPFPIYTGDLVGTGDKHLKVGEFNRHVNPSVSRTP